MPTPTAYAHVTGGHSRTKPRKDVGREFFKAETALHGKSEGPGSKTKLFSFARLYETPEEAAWSWDCVHTVGQELFAKGGIHVAYRSGRAPAPHFQSLEACANVLKKHLTGAGGDALAEAKKRLKAIRDEVIAKASQKVSEHLKERLDKVNNGADIGGADGQPAAGPAPAAAVDPQPGQHVQQRAQRSQPQQQQQQGQRPQATPQQPLQAQPPQPGGQGPGAGINLHWSAAARPAGQQQPASQQAPPKPPAAQPRSAQQPAGSRPSAAAPATGAPAARAPGQHSAPQPRPSAAAQPQQPKAAAPAAVTSASIIAVGSARPMPSRLLLPASGQQSGAPSPARSPKVAAGSSSPAGAGPASDALASPARQGVQPPRPAFQCFTLEQQRPPASAPPPAGEQRRPPTAPAPPAAAEQQPSLPASHPPVIKQEVAARGEPMRHVGRAAVGQAPEHPAQGGPVVARARDVHATAGLCARALTQPVARGADAPGSKAALKQEPAERRAAEAGTGVVQASELPTRPPVPATAAGHGSDGCMPDEALRNPSVPDEALGQEDARHGCVPDVAMEDVSHNVEGGGHTLQVAMEPAQAMKGPVRGDGGQVDVTGGPSHPKPSSQRGADGGQGSAGVQHPARGLPDAGADREVTHGAAAAWEASSHRGASHQPQRHGPAPVEPAAGSGSTHHEEVAAGIVMQVERNMHQEYGKMWPPKGLWLRATNRLTREVQGRRGRFPGHEQVCPCPELLSLLYVPLALMEALWVQTCFWARQQTARELGHERHLQQCTQQSGSRQQHPGPSPCCEASLQLADMSLVLVRYAEGVRLRRVAAMVPLDGVDTCVDWMGLHQPLPRPAVLLEGGASVQLEQLLDLKLSSLPPQAVQDLLLEFLHHLEGTADGGITRSQVVFAADKLQRFASVSAHVYDILGVKDERVTVHRNGAHAPKASAAYADIAEAFASWAPSSEVVEAVQRLPGAKQLESLKQRLSAPPTAGTAAPATGQSVGQKRHGTSQPEPVARLSQAAPSPGHSKRQRTTGHPPAPASELPKHAQPGQPTAVHRGKRGSGGKRGRGGQGSSRPAHPGPSRAPGRGRGGRGRGRR